EPVEVCGEAFWRAKAEYEIAANGDRTGGMPCEAVERAARGNARDALASPGFIGAQGKTKIPGITLERGDERCSILDCHGGALRRIGAQRMGSITDEDDTGWIDPGRIARHLVDRPCQP